jgi:hypothetical protein
MSNRITIALTLLLATGCMAEEWEKRAAYQDWSTKEHTKIIRDMNVTGYLNCLDTPWLTSPETDHTEEFPIFKCECKYHVPDCFNGTVPQDKPYHVLAETFGHAETCGENACRAFIASQGGMAVYEGFECRHKPEVYVRDWRNDSVILDLLPSLEWKLPRVHPGLCFNPLR